MKWSLRFSGFFFVAERTGKVSFTCISLFWNQDGIVSGKWKHVLFWLLGKFVKLVRHSGPGIFPRLFQVICVTQTLVSLCVLGIFTLISVPILCNILYAYRTHCKSLRKGGAWRNLWRSIYSGRGRPFFATNNYHGTDILHSVDQKWESWECVCCSSFYALSGPALPDPCVCPC